MRQAAGIFRNAAVVGETRDHFYVRERRPAQRQPFGLEHAATRLAQCRSRDILQHVGLLYAKTKTQLWNRARVLVCWTRAIKRGGRFPASPLEPLRAPPVQQDPADSFCPPFTRPQPPSSEQPIQKCGRWLLHETRHGLRPWQREYDQCPCRH